VVLAQDEPLTLRVQGSKHLPRADAERRRFVEADGGIRTLRRVRGRGCVG
jgi:hypothetical protein